MRSITRLRRVGGSIMATVPKKLVEVEGLSPGQTVSIEIKKIKKSFLGAIKDIGLFTKKDKKWLEGRQHD